MNKRGMTLIEVVVATGILLMVFAGTTTLVVNVVQLSVNSRLRTIAVAYAQKAMTKCIGDYNSDPSLNSCVVPTLPSEIQSAGATIEKTWSPAYLNNRTTDVGLSNANFVRITVTVSWTIRGVTDDYSFVQLVKVPEA